MKLLSALALCLITPTVALEADLTDGKTYATAELLNVSGDWHKHSFHLTPSQTDHFAKLSILFRGKGTLYLDQASLESDAAKMQVARIPTR